MTLKTGHLGGLFVAPAVWALNTQLGQILPAIDCTSRTASIVVIAFASAGVAVAAAAVSARSRAVKPSRVLTFLALLSVLVALVFAFALFLQGAATLLISPCAR
jgi:hypothetical protein